MGTPYAQLDVFLTVARLRSFSAAARELRVTRSAVSQAVRQFEAQLEVVLLARTTRSVSLTEAGRRLVDGAGPAMTRARDALAEAVARPDEPTGRLRLTVPPAAVSLAIDPVVAAFRASHPKVEVEIDVERRFVDIVADRYDAGVRLRDAVPRDMVCVRLTGELRWIVVGAPAYLARHGTPREPDDLLRHECINFRLQSTGALYAWELERGRRSWRVPVRGGLLSNDSALRTSFAVQGLGLAYAFEPSVREELRDGGLRCVLEPYAATVPGFYLYYSSPTRHSPLLRRFVAVAKEWR